MPDITGSGGVRLSGCESLGLLSASSIMRPPQQKVDHHAVIVTGTGTYQLSQLNYLPTITPMT